jgi:hypothetical protein
MHPLHTQLVLQHILKIRFGFVADVIGHLKAPDFLHVSKGVGILTNSATHTFNCAEALGSSW